MMANPQPPEGYTVTIVPPPGPSIISPDGFPTPPLPPHAPAPFLDAMAVRLTVFCDEQKCSAANELDEDDARSWSWVVYKNSEDSNSNIIKSKDAGAGAAASIPVATVRLVPPPHGAHPNGYVDPHEEPYVKLTRLATVREERGKGLGRVLFDVALAWAGENPDQLGPGWRGMVLLHAQAGVEAMYARMGFVTDEKLGRWDEEGIEHLGMWKRVDVAQTGKYY